MRFVAGGAAFGWPRQCVLWWLVGRMPVVGRVCQNPVQTTLIWIGTILGMAELCGFWLVCRSVPFRLDGIWTVRMKVTIRRGVVFLGAGVLLAWTCGVAAAWRLSRTLPCAPGLNWRRGWASARLSGGPVGALWLRGGVVAAE